MEPYEPQLALGTALAVGLLIGLEREQSKQEGSRFAGVRTYPIFALLGALASMLAPALAVLVLAGVIALIAIAYAADLVRGRDPGVTTETSVIAAYLLGALATSHDIVEPIGDRMILVAALGVALTFVLSSKTWIHDAAARVSRDDLFATLKFLIVAVIVLPLLPRTEIGPIHAITPFQIGLLTVTIAGFSFGGYVAIRWLGPGRGRRERAAVRSCLAGNLRELAAAIAHAIESNGARLIDDVHLPASVRPPAGAWVPGTSLDALERHAILATLDSVGGSVPRAAAILGLSVRTIQYRLQRYRA